MPDIKAGTIEVGKLVVADDNVRAEVGDVSEMAASMKSVGVLEPLLVREGDLLVVCGARRLAAAKEAGLKEVPCLVRPFTEAERLEAMVVENVQRESLSPLEEARAFARLREHMAQATIAKRVGCSTSHVSRMLGLIELPEKVQKMVDSGAIAGEITRELVKVQKNTPDVDVTKLAAKMKNQPKAAPQIAAAEVAKVEHAAELDKARAALLKRDKKAVEITLRDDYGYGLKLPDGYQEVEAKTYRVDVVEMDPAKHKKLDCHAAAVHPKSLEVIELCSDVSNHPSKAEKQEKRDEKVRKQIEKERAEEEAETNRRREWLKAHLAARVDKQQVIEASLMALLLEGSMFGGAQFDMPAAQLLELPWPVDETELDASGNPMPVEIDEVDWFAMLAERAAKSPTELARVTHAIALAKLEDEAERLHWDVDSMKYADLLAERGYEWSAGEQRKYDVAKEREEASRAAAEEASKSLDENDAKSEEEAEAEAEGNEPEAEVDLVDAIKKAAEAANGKEEAA